ncbi:hypothetical protein OAG1_27220 [Agarivorans sp. OAG1]|uniref:Uncharacterized protein n=1 Tax=Agarivorans albus MKT 106 TaxID=1331007 RepID=R9PJB6_AGAAL|nr:MULTISPECIES: hypothetical protein [Agarivorans]MPW27467.1 hypothetical protein [Agarivorans sp. B2Z047]UQN44691.1 hypothetical protein LQZ07_09550 [Agarivorans sp. B2Z047]BEU03922.1 hypothetical protein OAG1_27220 [Agarivorans sp. OAG1]GAD01474.1 hypothetical protein AALB_1554 [Agarivorans albus MKT 106]
MTDQVNPTIYAFDIAENTYYFFDQLEAEQAFQQAEAKGDYPEWREPTPMLELLKIKDALLGEFAKRIAFLELQLERAELGSDSFDLGAN